MTDEELIARLRDDSGDWLTDAAADRIEALVKRLETAVDVVAESGRLRGQAEARAEQLAATNKRLEAALKRVLRNVDEDGVGTVLMIDLIHARAALKGADHE